MLYTFMGVSKLSTLPLVVLNCCSENMSTHTEILLPMLQYYNISLKTYINVLKKTKNKTLEFLHQRPPTRYTYRFFCIWVLQA